MLRTIVENIALLRSKYRNAEPWISLVFFINVYKTRNDRVLLCTIQNCVRYGYFENEKTHTGQNLFTIVRLGLCGTHAAPRAGCFFFIPVKKNSFFPRTTFVRIGGRTCGWPGATKIGRIARVVPVYETAKNMRPDFYRLSAKRLCT